MTIAHLTKAIALKDDFIEARLMRAEALLKMKQYKETMEDIDAVLAQNPEEETAILLRGKVKEANGQGRRSRSRLPSYNRSESFQRSRRISTWDNFSSTRRS